jgi:hypothetical protein
MAETAAGVRLHNDEYITVFDLYVETPQPQLALIGDGLAAAKIELEAVPRTTEDLPRPVHEQYIRLIAMGMPRQTSVFEIGSLMRTARADSLDFA